MNQQPDSDQTGRILAAVENMVNKKIENDQKRCRERIRARKNLALIHISLVIILGCGSGAIVANAYLQNFYRDEQTLQEANQIKNDLAQKISDALTSLRELSYATTMTCKNTAKQIQWHRIAEERIKARYNLLRISRPMMYYLGEDFSSALSSFIAWEQSISDNCALSAPTEAEWLTQQMGIEERMNSAPVEVFVGH